MKTNPKEIRCDICGLPILQRPDQIGNTTLEDGGVAYHNECDARARKGYRFDGKGGCRPPLDMLKGYSDEDLVDTLFNRLGNTKLIPPSPGESGVGSIAARGIVGEERIDLTRTPLPSMVERLLKEARSKTSNFPFDLKAAPADDSADTDAIEWDCPVCQETRSAAGYEPAICKVCGYGYVNPDLSREEEMARLRREIAIDRARLNRGEEDE